MVKYLGCEINREGDSKKELSQRIANAMRTLKRLDTFWRNSNCPIAFKIIALDAVIKTKVLYGLDSMQLNEPELKRLEKIHLQAMRKILKWDTTYINRENTNAKIYEEVNKRIKEQGREKHINTFVENYKKIKLKRIKRAIRDNKELHEATFERNLKPRTPPNRIKGRPKYKWAERALKEYWETLQKEKPEIANLPYDNNNENIIRIIKTEANI